MPTADAKEWDGLKTAPCLLTEVQRRMSERADRLAEKTKGVDMSGGMEDCAALNRQEGGSHYRKLKIQPIEYILANDLPYCEANIVKYATRHKDKGGAEDIRKVIHYCQFILESQYGVTA